MLGSSVLLKLNDELVVGQGDSSLNLANSLLEKAAGENGAKQYLYDEQDGDLSITVMAEKPQEMALFNLWANRMEVECYYGGVNEGDIYYHFKGLITSFNKGDPSGGLSTIALGLKVNGKPTMKVVSNVEEVYYTLTVNINSEHGSVYISPNYGSYQNGESVFIRADVLPNAILSYFVVNGSTIYPGVNGGIHITMLQDTIVNVVTVAKANLQIYFDGWTFTTQSSFYLQSDYLNYLSVIRLGGNFNNMLIAKKMLPNPIIANGLKIDVSPSTENWFFVTIRLKLNGVIKWTSGGFDRPMLIALQNIEADEIEILAQNTEIGDNADMVINAPIELFFN